ncbi:MAG: acetate kinase [Eggerthellaceae bacterium]|nr:acetate kinase [Eggerthellaceae bacterium]
MAWRRPSALSMKGNCERVTTNEAFCKHKNAEGNERLVDRPMLDHNEAMAVVLECLLEGETRSIESLNKVDAIGHRVVQGGKYFDKSCIVDDEVIAKIEELSELAPLHNPPAIMGIKACEKAMPGKPMVTTFDSAYFYSLPEYVSMYPIPYEYYEKYSIRRYGAHGTSHRFVANAAYEFLGKDESALNLITCHIGNGASISAIKGGKAIDTSMGMTPLEGLMMGTRTGSIDPAIITFLMEHEGIAPNDMTDLLNKKSGLLGVTGETNDLRSVHNLAAEGDERAKLALKMYTYIIRKFIGQYIVALGIVDAIVMTAGVGENDDRVRFSVFEGLEHQGMILDKAKNATTHGILGEISTSDSPVKILVIPTNEELAIAQDVYKLLN